MSLAAGVLVAILVEMAGLSYISRTGGQGNPAELQLLVGRMLVPVVAGVVIATCIRVLPAFSSKLQTSAHLNT